MKSEKGRLERKVPRERQVQTRIERSHKEREMDSKRWIAKGGEAGRKQKVMPKGQILEMANKLKNSISKQFFLYL